MRTYYNKISEWLDTKKITLIVLVIFSVLLIPVLYLSFVNRASGDDLGYGVYTRAAWVSTHSLWQVFLAACRTIKQYYIGWQGTWFSIFVFSLQPEVFSERAYVITAFLMLFLWIGSTCWMLRELLFKILKFSVWSCILAVLLFLIINIQFIPSTKSSIFWFNGCAHYLLPFAMCQIVVVLLIKYAKKYKYITLTGISIIMSLLGGSNYQAALFALIVTGYIGTLVYLKQKDKRIFLLLIPMILETSGLIISMKAPGNKVRGGEDFGFSFLKVSETICRSFLEGGKTVVSYIQEKPLVFVGLLVLFLVFLEACMEMEEPVVPKYPFIVILSLICLYSAMQAPAIYAGVGVSSGVHNMNFQVFLLMAAGILLIIAGQAAEKMKGTKKNVHNVIVIPGFFVCMILIVFFRSGIKETTSWVSLDYIRTGQAADYKEQMDLQTKLLLDENTTDVVLPFINHFQGPLMHMPVTEEAEAWTNTVNSQFYGKNSVIAIPRPEWNEKYGAVVKGGG